MPNLVTSPCMSDCWIRYPFRGVVENKSKSEIGLMLDIQHHIFTHEYRLSNSIQHYYLFLKLEYRMSN